MMKWIGSLAACAIVTLAGCSTPGRQPGPGDVYVMRHLQAGTGSDPSLTQEGAKQAQLLASWFRSRDRPRAIYVTRYLRSRETAAPLAASLKLTPIVYDPSNNDALVQLVRSNPGNALIVGHSNTVPEIVEKFGGPRPPAIEHHQHGDIWRVSRSGKTDMIKLETR